MADHYCHREVRRIAREMAGVFYETGASKNDVFFKAYPRQMDFVNSQWPGFVVHARQTLTAMLGLPHYSDKVKEEIYDIVLKDKELQSPATQGLYLHEHAGNA